MSENSKGRFSRSIKEELLGVVSPARHCRIAEIAAVVAFLGRLVADGKSGLTIGNESLPVSKKFFTLLDKTINISEYINKVDHEGLVAIEKLIKPSDSGVYAPVNEILLQQECCRKAYLRGAFLAAGTVSDPTKSYHLEITTENEALAEQVLGVFSGFSIPAGHSKRKSSHVIYVKDAASLVETLGIMGAPLGLMEFENVRIIKDIRNDLNRKVNCEAANIKKTIDAAITQIEDIEYIEAVHGLRELPKGLYEIARARRAYPEVSLAELGQMLNPPVGKSGVNHRLRRISQFADNLRREGHKR